jgi:NADH:ubiquinone oxidoreductase subunit F (NADH-binding)/(2Fe-2S) ferredoxin
MAVQRHILVCGGSGCHDTKSGEVFQRFFQEIDAANLTGTVQIVQTGCLGFCETGTVVKVLPDEEIYVGVGPEDVREIVTEHVKAGRLVSRLLYDRSESKKYVGIKDLDFYQKQFRIVLRNCGVIDPEEIHEYIARDGYAALEKVLFDMTPDDVVATLKTSKLRGRGGAGFPTWMKWNFTRQSTGECKYVICNADEGDPGAYMDRSVLEGDPHSVLEAMAICGRTIGANQGYIYIRAEYPLAIKRLELAIEQATDMGLLGKDILGTGFDFDIELRLGAGAFVCGEETALLASIEGERGMPRPRPPFPSVKGLWGQPTVINNVETCANIPVIINRGGEWFASIGTEDSTGTKVFALTGKIANSGLVEVPMGTPLRDIVFNIGGGIPDGKAFKAVQTGGPSGGVITADYLDTPIDYTHLQELGSIMGSGGMIVMDETDCIVDVAKFYLEFTVEESCGKCAPCRIGGRKLHNILTRITNGTGTQDDIQKMRTIGSAMQKASLCGLGQTAPNPILSTLRYFQAEYDAHINEKLCPAGVCKDLVRFEIITDNCIGCGICARKCPVGCITGERREPHEIDQSRCIKCGECFKACKFDAVLKA